MGRKLGRWFFLSPMFLFVIGIIVGVIYLISMLTGFNPLTSLLADSQTLFPLINIIISIIFPLFVIGIILLATTPGKNAPIFTVKGSIRQGWALAKPYILNFFLVSLFFSALQGATFLLSFVVPIIPNILMPFIGVWMLLAYQKMALSASRKLPFVFKNIFISIKKIFFFLVANTISFIYISFGLVLFIIPGIRRSLRLSMVPFCILDQDIGPFAAIKASWKMTKGFVADLYLFFLMSGLILFLGAILLGIGLIWAIPTYLIAQAYIYIRITMKSTSETTETVAPVTQQTN